jgi:hypothetical protein
MSELNSQLQELKELEGPIIPYTNVELSLPTIKGGGGMNDTVAQITKIRGNKTPDDHFFRVTLPDKPLESRGKIEVDDTQGGDPRLTILDEGILENPDVLGPMVKVALRLAGVDSGIVEVAPSYTNLPPTLLERVGDAVIQASDRASSEFVTFEAVPSSEIHDHPLPVAA